MARQIPHLRAHKNGKHVYVDGRPFLILGGELGNSAMSSASYMQDVWPRLKKNHLNTVLGSISWRGMEPQEGHFDFSELDAAVLGARQHDLRLIILWFGAWKNGHSNYAPNWVKMDSKRFPKMYISKAGEELSMVEVLSNLSEEVLKADEKAFVALMQRIKEIDQDHGTVIMIQVQNEIGLLADSRDRSELANLRYNTEVPQDLLQMLNSKWDTLNQSLRQNLGYFKNSQTKQHGSTWPEVFGHDAHTEELFMSYYYANYVQKIVTSGKNAYPLPMYTNAWLSCNVSERDDEAGFPLRWGHIVTRPGTYPSGGPNQNVLDIWQHFCSSMDIFSPDIYLNRYESACEQFAHNGNSLFVAEMRRDARGARRIWQGFGSYGAIGMSPFGIDTVEHQYGVNPFAESYEVLSAAAPEILAAQQRPGSSFGFYFDEPVVQSKLLDHEERVVDLGTYRLTITRSFTFGQPTSAAGMIIWLGGEKFLLLGWGFMVAFASTSKDSRFTGLLSMREKEQYRDSSAELVDGRDLNGDETRTGQNAVMPHRDVKWGDMPIAITIPGRTGIAEVEVYSL